MRSVAKIAGTSVYLGSYTDHAGRYPTSSAFSRSLVVVLLVWVLSTVTVRFLFSGYFSSLPDLGAAADVSKAAVHIAMALIMAVIACRKRILGLAIRPLINDPLMWMFFVTQCASSMMGQRPLPSLLFVGILSILFVIARLYVTLATSEELLRGLALLSHICATISCVLALFLFRVDRSIIWDNMCALWVGQLAMLAGCLAFASFNTWLRWVSLTAAFASMVIVNSRGPLLGLLVALFVVWCLPSRRALLFTIFGSLFFAGLYLGLPARENFLKEASERVLRLEDPSRGIGSGFSGRLSAWRQAWKEFTQRPLLGSGPRTDASQERSAHNAYLSTLLEVGFLGALPILGLFARAFCWQRRKLCSIPKRLLLTVVIASLVLGLVQYELFNCITPLTVIIVIWLEYSRPTIGQARVAQFGP